MISFDISKFPGSLHPTISELSKETEFTAYSDRGGNGYVLFGENKVLKRPIVLKIYFWDNGDHAEPEMLAKLEHENILQVYHAAAIDDDYAYFATRFCPDGDLDRLIAKGPIAILRAIDIVMQICAGVSFLHGNNYLHRDLKPLNIFCDSGKFVVGDFGSVVQCDENGYAKTLTRHSLLYRPPETADGNDYYKQGDVYQLGILLYQLLGGWLPYEETQWLNEKQHEKYLTLTGFDQQKFATDIITGKIRAGTLLNTPGLPPFVPTGLRTVIRRATNQNKEKRYASVADLAGALNNLKGSVPDWQFPGGVPTLHRENKTVRILQQKGSFLLQKKTSAEWRNVGGSATPNLSHAVIKAMEL
ncbi:hypothetical protein B5E41_00295 [Rhizobium esperanzae]|uniref:Protein kinase domain-containing protein n=1 Tax=Rhizobium esperanzae TaxID=1967781 RepID=A0A246E1G7_9HYPH|nr:serine/threonine-protein kinase [Rhizobium esperanzae]OWO96774.1 hypothetical protein B5E41_00295 [Rhizobium esperanzae]